MEERTLKPLFDRVVVARLGEQEKTSGGIFIPDQARERPLIGKVVAVGPGIRTALGVFIPTVVKVGDYVLFGKYSGIDTPREFFSHEGDDVAVMREEEIFGVLDPSVVLKPVAA